MKTPEDVIRHALFSCGIEESEKVEVPEILHQLAQNGYSIKPTRPTQDERIIGE